jgi:RNA polymerase sigma factor (sigma-70 family)
MTDYSPLVHRIRNGDAAAEDELVRLYERRVFWVVRRRVQEHETSRELADDVLMAVVCALRDGRLHDAGKLRAFIYGTARNLANNYIRSRAARPIFEPLPLETAAPEHADVVEEKERAEWLERGLSRLARKDREILFRSIVDGQKPRQIAVELGISAVAVRTRKSRALHRLIARSRHSDQ